MPRFAASLAKKMAGEEYRGLLQRTAIQTDGRLRCICLVAVSPDAHVCGSLDLRMPAEASGCHPPGVPEVLTMLPLACLTAARAHSTTLSTLHCHEQALLCSCGSNVVASAACMACAQAPRQLLPCRMTRGAHSWSMWQCTAGSEGRALAARSFQEQSGQQHSGSWPNGCTLMSTVIMMQHGGCTSSMALTSTMMLPAACQVQICVLLANGTVSDMQKYARTCNSPADLS
jgi:hypothetical protein